MPFGEHLLLDKTFLVGIVIFVRRLELGARESDSTFEPVALLCRRENKYVGEFLCMCVCVLERNNTTREPIG